MFNTLHPLYPMRSMTGGNATASQSLTVGTAASGFATAFAASTNLVTFDVQTNTVRVRWDGTDPSGTVGHILTAGNAYTWDKTMAANAKFIRISTATADATIFLSELSG